MAEAREESVHNLVFKAVVDGLAMANQERFLQVLSLNVGINGGTVTARMSMPGKDGLPSGKTFCVSFQPTAKSATRPSIPSEVVEHDNNLKLLMFVLAFLPGTILLLPPHHDEDAFASIKLVSGENFTVSSWYVHDADAARAMRKKAKEEELALRAEEDERLRKQKLERKAEERERERQKSLGEKVESDRRRKEVRDSEAEKALQEAQALGFKTVEDMKAAQLKEKQAADAADLKTRDEVRKVLMQAEEEKKRLAAQQKAAETALLKVQKQAAFVSKNVKGQSSGSSSQSSSRGVSPPPTSGGSSPSPPPTSGAKVGGGYAKGGGGYAKGESSSPPPPSSGARGGGGGAKGGGGK